MDTNVDDAFVDGLDRGSHQGGRRGFGAARSSRKQRKRRERERRQKKGTRRGVREATVFGELDIEPFVYETLPDDVFVHIFLFLDVWDILCHIRLSCVRFRNLCHTPFFWHHLCRLKLRHIPPACRPTLPPYKEVVREQSDAADQPDHRSFFFEYLTHWLLPRHSSGISSRASTSASPILSRTKGGTTGWGKAALRSAFLPFRPFFSSGSAGGGGMISMSEVDRPGRPRFHVLLQYDFVTLEVRAGGGGRNRKGRRQQQKKKAQYGSWAIGLCSSNPRGGGAAGAGSGGMIGTFANSASFHFKVTTAPAYMRGERCLQIDCVSMLSGAVVGAQKVPVEEGVVWRPRRNTGGKKKKKKRGRRRGGQTGAAVDDGGGGGGVPMMVLESMNRDHALGDVVRSSDARSFDTGTMVICFTLSMQNEGDPKLTARVFPKDQPRMLDFQNSGVVVGSVDLDFRGPYWPVISCKYGADLITVLGCF